MDDAREATFPVVGIGASAGGLEALNALVAAIPSDSGCAYVIIQHLAPDHPSMMDQLLASHASIPVQRIEDGMQVQADCIHVLPPGAAVTISGEILHLHPRQRDEGLRTPIDRFLASLAESHGRNAFAVILSGTGSDGTQGVRAVKAAGGYAIVQQSDSARFPGMPESASATGLVDFTHTPARIPGRIFDIVRHRSAIVGRAEAQALRAEIEARLPDILAVIDAEDGHDFSQYKPGTLVRRIERRMTMVLERDVSAFLARLHRSGEERARLLQDFLIGATRFFRDEAAFDGLLERVLLPLLSRDQSAFRIWAPGCSTGEEAYSVAMLMAEAMEDLGDKRQGQIFGTDIDGSALSVARGAHYSDTQLDGVTEERRARFFVSEDGVHQVAPALRERCIFAPHNLLVDPPFSRLDLICCRNLLIYLNADVQQTIIPRFHYGLRRGGFLFLGPSETLGKQERLFHTIDRDARIFRRNDAERTAFTPLLRADRDSPRRERRLGLTPTPIAVPPSVSEPSFEAQLLSFFARQSAPPFATINSGDEVTYLSERMNRFIGPSQGQPSAALDQFLIRDLRLPVRTVIAEVRETGDRAVSENVVVSRGKGAPDIVDVEAVPLPFAEGSVLVTLQPVRMQDAADLSGSTRERDSAERDLIERELSAARRQLATAMTRYETSEQELKSSNEELLSMNEELQSSNEELETSREELQSINEELETINAELSENNTQLASAHSDLTNLFDSTDIATVFLDQQLQVRRFTPAALRLLHIQERDIGRPINDLKWKVAYDALEEDAAHVSETLQTVERELPVEAADETYLMRIRPYRRNDDRIDGSVLTFVDISARKRLESRLAETAETLARQYAELETLYATTPVGLCILDRDLRYVRINETLARMNGLSVEDHLGKRPEEVFGDGNPQIIDMLSEVLATGQPFLNFELTAATPGAGRRDYLVDFYPLVTNGEIFAVGVTARDVTDRNAAAREAARRNAEVEALYNTVPIGLFLQDAEGRFLRVNAQLAARNGLSPEDHIGKTPEEVLGPIPDVVTDAFRHVVETGEAVSDLEAVIHPPGAPGPVHLLYDFRAIEIGETGTRAVAGTVRDVTAERIARRDAERSRARLAFALETAGMGAWEVDLSTGAVERTGEHDRIFGLDDPPETWSADSTSEFVVDEDRAQARAAYEEAISTGRRMKLQFRIRRADGALRWVEVHGQPVAGAPDDPSKFAGTIQDVTERHLATERRTLLLHELQHRVKNTMATALAIVKFSASRARDLPSFTQSLQERLEALSRTHDLLSAQDWEGAPLRTVFDREVAAYADETNGDRITYEGATPMLSARQALTLALGFHELATNAAKYGALSVDGGRVALSCEIDDARVATVTWRETGGPPVTPPQEGATGFGSVLLERIIGADLGGTSGTEYGKAGLVWQVLFQL